MKRQIALILLFAFFVSVFSGCNVFSKPQSVHFEEIKSFTAEEKKLKTDTCVITKKILVNPANRQEIFVLTNAGFLHSEDAGESWTVLNFPKPDIIQFATISENGTLYAVEGLGKLYSYSKNGWKYISGINYKVDITCLCAGEKNILYVKSDYWLYKSEDGGVNFYKMKLPVLLDRTGDYKVYVNPFKRNEIYLYGGIADYVSEDSGNTWKGLNIPHENPFSDYPRLISLCAGSANSLLIIINTSSKGGTERNKSAVFSFDGKNWKIVAENLPFGGEIYANPFDKNELFLCSRSLFVIKNGTLTPHGLLDFPACVAAVGKGDIIAANYYGKLFVMKEGKGRGNFVGSDDERVSAISVCNGKTYAVTDSGIYALKNSGSGESVIESVRGNMPVGKSFLPFIITFPEKNCLTVYGVCDGNSFSIISREGGKTKKTDFGEEFIADVIKGPLPFSVLISTSEGIYLYSAESGKLKKIGFDGKVVNCLYTDKNTIYAGLHDFSSGSAIYRSVDYGKTWVPVDSGMLGIKDRELEKDIRENAMPAAIYADGEDIYVSVDFYFFGQQDILIGEGKLKAGLYASKDGGKNWEYVWPLVENKKFPVVFIDKIWKYKGKVFVLEQTQCGGNKILYSSDLKNWKTFNAVDPAYPRVTSLYPKEPSGILYIGTFGKVYSALLP